jgi:GTP pyrophosphokinase
MHQVQTQAPPEATAAASLPARERALWADTDCLLRGLGCDDETRAAAAWYALQRVRPAVWAETSVHATEGLRLLVEGQQRAERVWALHTAQATSAGVEGLRRLLLATIGDLRVVYLLLARQLARMRAATILPAAERRELAQLTRDIHAPLANRLGIGQWKWELEDLAFRHLEPARYHHIAKWLDQRRADREAWIARSAEALRDALRGQEITASVSGRAKHIYSIWAKMQRKHVEFANLYDIHALRVLTDSVSDCYAVLGIVHALWPMIPAEFDDYIARPKGNGYRSLHTAVVGPDHKVLEVQIRTRAMHRVAELGIPAHWRYKEGAAGDAPDQAQVAGLRRLLETRDGQAGSAADPRAHGVDDRVYVLTPAGKVIDLPAGATVLDFAYRVHTMVGHRCRGAEVNRRIVPLTHRPVSGDRVRILTAREPAPSRDWLAPRLGYLTTASARHKLRAWFRREDLAAHVAAGRQMLEREGRRLAAGAEVLERVPAKLGFRNRDELLARLASGDIGPARLTRAILESKTPPQSTGPPPVRPDATPSRDRPGALTVAGVGNLLTTRAHCCRPLPGDQAVGYLTRSRGVTVHRSGCAVLAQLRKRAPDHVVEVEWQSARGRAYEVAIAVVGKDRRGFEGDVTDAIVRAGARIVAADRFSRADQGVQDLRFTVQVRDRGELSGLLARLTAMSHVIDAHRLAST